MDQGLMPVLQYWNDYQPRIEQSFRPRREGAIRKWSASLLRSLGALGSSAALLRGAIPDERWVRNHRFPLAMLMRLARILRTFRE